jgi:hypothetical protein
LSEPHPSSRIVISLNAAIVTVDVDQAAILVVRPGGTSDRHLPYGPFEPDNHLTLERGLRAWVTEQTRLNLGYVEQLYTFGDQGRHSLPGQPGVAHVSVGYLALTRRETAAQQTSQGQWCNWYDFFPWEDWRQNKPAIIDDIIIPALENWADEPARLRRAHERINLCFGLSGLAWDEEKVLERYELLYEAGLVAEAGRKGRHLHHAELAKRMGQQMNHDHRRILATAMGRLRGKLKYRPVVFELMAPEFTLFELQRSVEAISGRHLHKQNFRRLVEKGGLVEATGTQSTTTGGRPASLFSFRREVLQERPAPGLRVSARS